MTEPNLKQALAYQRAAYAWLSLAQQTDDPVQRPRLLAIANEWLEMAHESFGHPTTDAPPKNLH